MPAPPTQGQSEPKRAKPTEVALSTMRWLRVLAIVAVAAAFVVFAVTTDPWTPAASPQLVQVRDVTPTDVEPGDRIAIAGEGFPAGKEARVAFRGTLHRPGEWPVEGAEIVVTGVVAGPERVDVSFGEATQALFCGVGARAVHTTFEGDVEVAFAAAMPGAAPIGGVLRHAMVDVRPSASVEDRGREPEGDRILAFVGLHAAAAPRRGLGLTIDSVQSGSRAEAAGLAPGDVVTSFDGVRVAAAADLVPPAGEREATLGVRTGASASASESVPKAPDAVRILSVDGFRRTPPSEILGAALFVVAALAILVFFGSPLHSGIATSLQRGVSRLRERGGTRANARPAERRGRPDTWAAVIRGMLSAAAQEVTPPPSLPALVDAVACALLAGMPFGQYLVAARLDVGLLFLVGVTGFAIAAVVAAGSAWNGLRAAAHVAWQHVPAAIAVASVVLTTGSLRVQEIDRAQGGWPWDWLAFRSPGALLALALLLASALIELTFAKRSSGVEHLIDDTANADGGSRGSQNRWVSAASRAHGFIIAGLAVTLFLGGWSLPGLSPEQQDARPLFEVAGAIWLLAKTWGVVLALAALRLALPRRHLLEATRATTVWRVPLALASFAITGVWNWWSPERAVELLVSGSLVAIAGLASVAAIQRVRHGVFSPGGDGHLSPFL
jgi:NADH-quinone oxidoreductase subunit H